jgi:hypothetical protein
MAEIEAIGVISGLLGIFQFAEDHLPTVDPTTSTVKIGVGLDGTPDPNNPDATLSNAGGDLPDVRVWNENLDFIGITADPGYVNDGTEGSITVDQNGNAQQVPYVLLSANDDALCIAFASIAWPDGSKYAWVGDWGAACGATWYYSNYFVNNGGTPPACTWIDKNGDQPATGLSMHFPSFVSTDGSLPADTDVSSYCNNHDTFEVHYEPDPNSISAGHNPIVPRSVPTYGGPNATHPHWSKPQHHASSQKFKGRLVVSKSKKHHRADRLCNDPNSAGPDFLNVAEGKFCRMSDKTTWDVCTDNMRADCFEAESRQLILSGVKGVQKRSDPYYRVEDWTPSQPDEDDE